MQKTIVEDMTYMVEDMVEDMEIVNISVDVCKKHALGHGLRRGTRDAPTGGEGFLAELP